jgi:hypothetical protein
MTPTPAQPKVDIVTAPDCRTDYTNNTTCNITFWDFILIFGRMEQTEPGKFTVTNFQKITMSPQMAKASLGILTKMVESYEQLWGTIGTLPTESIDTYRGATAAVQ